MNFRETVFLQHLAQTTPFPLGIAIERADGIYLFSPDGKKYMDLISGIAVSNIGHGHPHVKKAIHDQVERHLHVMVYGEFIQSAPNLLVEKLTSLLPPSLNCCYLTNSGTEANEGALKLVKRFTQRQELVSFAKSYHGSTHGSLSVSGNEKKKSAFRPLLPDVRFLPFNDIGALEQISERTAGVIIETIQGDAGVRIPSRAFMKALRKRCDDVGALLIFDEIQCGMGRTGKWFAFEHFSVVPDVVTIAKAFGGGLPLGAFVSDREIMRTLQHDPMLGHITTFGGNPVCCAASLAAIEVIEQENLLASVEEKGQLFEKLLHHKKIRAMRRIGLMFAIDFETEEEVAFIVQELLTEGVICFWFLSHPNSFRIAPPLTITTAEITEACRRIVAVIERSAAQHTLHRAH